MIFQQFTQSLLENRCEPLPQPVQSGSQRRAPLLVPGMSSRIAPAVGMPPLHSVYTTPGTIFDNLHRISRRMLLEKLPLVDQLRELGFLDVVQNVAQCHLPEMVMMPITLAVGRDVNPGFKTLALFSFPGFM
jgi:hypothetical protein